MKNSEIIKELIKIQQRIEGDNYTWENIQTLINKLLKENL